MMYFLPVTGSEPLMVKLAMDPKQAAGARSGIACASAPNTASTTRSETSAEEPDTAIGNLAFRNVLSGTMTLIGLKMPEFIGTSGNACLMAMKTAAIVAEIVPFKGPFTGPLDPVKSMVISSLAMVTLVLT